MDYFGDLLTIEASGCNIEAINDVKTVYNFMVKAVEVAEMKIIQGPVVFPYTHPIDSLEDGISGNLILADSHGAFHSFINDGYAFFDIFSCKPFNRSALKKLFVETFQPKKIKTSVKKRGKGYKRSFNMI